MQITKMRTNHLENPLGYETDLLTLSWIADSTGKSLRFSRVEIALDPGFKEIVSD